MFTLSRLFIQDDEPAALFVQAYADAGAGKIGQSLLNGWNEIVINTTVYNSIGASLSSNHIVIPNGVFFISAGVGNGKGVAMSLELQRLTTNICRAASNRSTGTNSSDGVASLETVIENSSSDYLRLYADVGANCNTGRSVDGGDTTPEVYAWFYIKRHVW